MSNKLYLLVDCNNFFISCERIFDPSLNNKPLIVLSNNDSCVISRSNEAKALGIKMGTPFFKIKEFCSKNHVIVLSSNYQLYYDISSRVMNILQSFTQNCEIYSIDEAFLEISGLEQNLTEYITQISEMIFKWTGIPVSIGVSTTKTLAKIACNIAKKQTNSYYILLDDIDLHLKKIEIQNIWGIGQKTASSLNELGIFTALDLIEFHRKKNYSLFNLFIKKIILELSGFPCKELEVTHFKKNITSSRSFEIEINDIDNLEEAISYHVSLAALKLRQQKSYALTIYVYLISIDRLDKQKEIYHSYTLNFDLATNNTSVIIKYAKKCLSKIYQPHIKYKKCGITLLKIVSTDNFQTDLFYKSSLEKNYNLSQVIDNLNYKMGHDTVTYGRVYSKQPWHTKQDFLSPKYTTSWKEIPKIN